jgi:branched-chain amino acid aminotransferase
VVTPVGRVCGREGDFTVGGGGPGQLTQRLKARLVAIQSGEMADRHGWMMQLD